jgi:choline dehydrogenase-like flavoprotein
VIIDYRNGPAVTDLDTQLCIIGAGAAGIAIAQAFVGTSIDVCIVESGGRAGTHDNQALYHGESVGTPHFNPGMSRMRVFGGSCNLWGGGCIPLSEMDMSRRDWVAHSGWPLTYAELVPYYEKAQSFCQIESHAFAEGSFLTPPSRTPHSFDDTTLINRIFARSPVFFGAAYEAELASAPNIKLLLHANLLELEPVPSGMSIRAARIGSLDGRRCTIRARHFVLACGAIENARLLLLSNSVAQNGLGNDRNLVGRFFMDHPAGKLGTLYAQNHEHVTLPYDRNGGKGPAPVFPELCLSDESQRAHRILNARVRPVAVEGPVPDGLHALRRLRAAFRSQSRDEGSLVEKQITDALKIGAWRNKDARPETHEHEGIGKLALKLGLSVGDIAQAVRRKWAGKPAAESSHVDLVGYFEQAPNPDSRVTLSDKHDALGQRKVCVDWRLTSLDQRTYRTAATLFNTRLADACQGRYEPESWLEEDGAVPHVRTTAHHMGTTRMADDPYQGVVDRHCRVHGIANLHIAGGSVFPTGGWAFPTFTIVALSLRLAEQLRVLLDKPEQSVSTVSQHGNVAGNAEKEW